MESLLSAPGVPDPHDPEYKQFLFGCECSKNNASCGDFDCSCVEESGCMDIHNNNDIAYNKVAISYWLIKLSTLNKPYRMVTFALQTTEKSLNATRLVLFL